MRKIKALLAVLCVVFAASAIIACNGVIDEPTKIAVAAPVINSKVYNGEKQAATVSANKAYVVLENNGGVDVGEYTVVLKLTDESIYEWETPDEADATKLTLKLAITKASNSINGFTLEGWRAGETANVPTATADFGEVKYAYSTAENGTYSETVPTAAGKYFVKAYVEETANYNGAGAIISFEITKAKEENSVSVTAVNVKYGENVMPEVTADATHVPQNGEIEYAYALTSDGQYVSWETIEKRAGKYYVKATVAEDDDYKGAFAIAEFEMLKGDNAISNFEIAEAVCKQPLVLSATATAGTVTYKYKNSADEDGEYVDIPADGLVAGTYYVKAYTAGDGNYEPAESEPVTLTVKHSHDWATDENGNDYLVCACGDEKRFVITPTSDDFEKTESGYAIKLYSAEEDGKANKAVTSFTVTLGDNEIEAPVMAWEQTPAGIVEITGENEYTIKALALGRTVLTVTYVNEEGKKAHIDVTVTVERVSKTVDVKHERILADLGTTEIDLSFASEYLGSSVSLTRNGKVLGDGAATNGKLTVNLSEIAETGELTFVANTDKGGVYYSFNVNVLFATKIIRNVEDMVAVRITADQLGAYTPVEGYYVLGNDIDFANAQIHSDYENVLQNLNNRYWNQNQGFRGTFDGLTHKISNVRVGQGGIFGFVGQNAVIRNVDFENVSYIGAYCGSLLAYSVINATVQDVNISVSAYKNGASNPETQGLLNAKFTAGCTYTNVKIDASAFDFYSLFGKEFKSGTFSGVEIKVKSYVMLADRGDGVNKDDKTVVPDGITVFSSKTVEIEHEAALVEKTSTEIDLSFASEYLGDSVKLTYNGQVLGEGAVTDGKLTVNLSDVAETGELVFLASTVKGSVTYTFNVNVLFATKIIRTVADLDEIKVTQAIIDNKESIYGYYVLGEDINLGWKKAIGTNLNYSKTDYWNQNIGFRGTFDGRGHTISNFCVNANGMFGHVGKGAVIKNVNFNKLKYNGQYLGSLFGGTVREAKITDITLNGVEYVKCASNPNDQGLFGGRLMRDSTLTKIKVDASNCEFYSLFGNEAENNTYNDVEIKVKSYTMFANRGSDVKNTDDKKVLPDGVTVTETATTTEA